jgi:pectin methylesterase-like acyl-CoA thioesterase
MLFPRIPAVLAGANFALGALAVCKANPSQTYADCQKKTADPLSGCPDGTLYVSQNDTTANFTSIQAAIASLPNNTDAYTILIGAGIYTEQLNVTRQGPLTLLGQSDRPANGESYSNVFGSNATDQAAVNDVQIYWNSANFNKTFTDNVYTGVCEWRPSRY